MHNKTFITVAVTLAALASILPVSAGAQLTYQERERAKAVAKIQAEERAKVDAAERQREYERRDNKRRACSNQGRHWDSVNEFCK